MISKLLLTLRKKIEKSNASRQLIGRDDFDFLANKYVTQPHDVYSYTYFKSHYLVIHVGHPVFPLGISLN